MNLFRKWYAKTTANWQDALHDENFRRYFLPNFIVCFVVHYSVVYWLQLNCNRPGMIIDDPVYHFLAPMDLSLPIFFFTYTGTILFLIHMAQYPFLLHRGLLTFVVVFAVRAACIHLIPLSPAPGIIPLYDPVTDALAHESHIMNDLFFSGHIADLTTFYFLSRSIRIKRYLLLCMGMVGTMLIWQRVHYTIDVVMAPAFAYLSYWIFVDKDFIWRAFLRKPELENS